MRFWRRRRPNRHSRFLKPVTHSGFGAEMDRARGLSLQFPSEVAQVHTQVVRLPLVLPPHFPQDLALRDQAPLLRTKKSSSAHSVGVRRTSSPARKTLRAARSTVRSPRERATCPWPAAALPHPSRPRRSGAPTSSQVRASYLDDRGPALGRFGAVPAIGTAMECTRWSARRAGPVLAQRIDYGIGQCDRSNTRMGLGRGTFHFLRDQVVGMMNGRSAVRVSQVPREASQASSSSSVSTRAMSP